MTRTPSLERCIAVASAVAWRERSPVQVLHLLLSTMFTDDRSSRSRLTLRELGVHHFLTDEGYVTFRAAVDDPERRRAPLTDAAKTVLNRLQYWATRTGDQSPDTVHLLLACLEAGSGDADVREAAREVGLSRRDVTRAAMTIRHLVSAADRQARVRGPILSVRRPDRPGGYQVENRWRASAGPRKVHTFKMRSQLTGAFDPGSPVHLYLLRVHLWLQLTFSVVNVVQLALIAYAAVTVTAWSAVWLASMLRRTAAPVWLRVAVDLGLVVASVMLDIPWWLAIVALVTLLLDIGEGRLALLEVRGDTADPSVSPRDLRSDARLNASASRYYTALKFKGELASE
jgi:hypothetical protein